MRAPTSGARTTPSISVELSAGAEELAPQWEELAEEISYGQKGGYYSLRLAGARRKSCVNSTQKLFDVIEPANTPSAFTQGFDRRDGLDR